MFFLKNYHDSRPLNYESLIISDYDRFFYEGEKRLVGQMYLEERKALYECVLEHKPKISLEIGTFTGGGSTFFISSALAKNKFGILHSLEIDKTLHLNAKIFYRNNLSELNEYIKFHLVSSLTGFWAESEIKTIDFLLLDGAESAIETLAQYNFLIQFMERNSILACHDWETEKMHLLKPVLNEDWELLKELGPPKSVGFRIFKKL